MHHPLAQSRLTTMRDKRSSNAQFRSALKELAAMLIYEAARELPVEPLVIDTPLCSTEGYRLRQPPLLVPVIRAGLGMVDAAMGMIPDAQVGFVGMARDETTHQPVPYLEALPDDLSDQPVFVIDPMLATGGSMIHTLRLISERGANDITAVCMVSAPQGVAALENSGLPVRLITATIDDGLNEDAFIVPGLGDAGDRLYGPRYDDVSVDHAVSDPAES